VADADQAEPVVGWVVLDPAGNVVDSGPPISLEMATSMGEPEEDD
jgi:hypothetical protein